MNWIDESPIGPGLVRLFISEVEQRAPKEWDFWDMDDQIPLFDKVDIYLDLLATCGERFTVLAEESSAAGIRQQIAVDGGIVPKQYFCHVPHSEIVDDRSRELDWQLCQVIDELLRGRHCDVLYRGK